MADTFTPNLGLTLMENGTHNNTWNDEYISNDERIDAKLGDVTTINSTGGTTVLSGTQERVNVIKCTGALVSNKIIEFSGIGGAWIIQNDHTGAFTLTVKKTGLTGVTVDQGSKAVVYFDGTDIATLTELTAASLGLGTGDSPQFAGINVGNASDTTVTRAAAGRLAVEGVVIEPGADRCSFRAHKTSNQSISATTTTDVTWVETSDDGAKFASNIWTPVAGHVKLDLMLCLSNTSGVDSVVEVAIYKNNSPASPSTGYEFIIGGTGEQPVMMINISMKDEANGTDTYRVKIRSSQAILIFAVSDTLGVDLCTFTGTMV